MKRALITGITGQDGSYLAEFLLAKGYEVHGMIRRSSSFNTSRIEHLYQDPHDPEAKLFLHYGDMTDGSSLRQVLEESHPDEVYNLAGQSHVKVSFDQPEYTADAVAVGTLRLLEAVRNEWGNVRFYQAGSSEMFGNAPEPQNESTPFQPRSPYAASKVAAHWYAVNYRESYEMFVCNGILFNHESPRRGETFVTRKITRAVGRIKTGLQDKLYLGNLEASRDWGFAGDYVEAMWLMLQQDKPCDLVIGTGQTHTVGRFAAEAFMHAGMDCQKHIQIDDRYFRPAEVSYLRADASKAHELLGWYPTQDFEDLVEMMVDHDIELAARESLIVKAVTHG